MATQDIRITRLEGRVQTLEDVQDAILDKLDIVIANQDELKTSQDELKANQVKIVGLIQALMQDVADIKARVIGRPMGFAPGDDE